MTLKYCLLLTLHMASQLDELGHSYFTCIFNVTGPFNPNHNGAFRVISGDSQTTDIMHFAEIFHLMPKFK